LFFFSISSLFLIWNLVLNFFNYIKYIKSTFKNNQILTILVSSGQDKKRRKSILGENKVNSHMI
ncbi:hypothetical protein, partial [Streptococcus pneumoniae]|uniref:hypothetical protein n=1 Tax=Streptococcus pneumoniae TaxID=1313 RepID=UPI001C5C8F96